MNDGCYNGNRGFNKDPSDEVVGQIPTIRSASRVDPEGCRRCHTQRRSSNRLRRSYGDRRMTLTQRIKAHGTDALENALDALPVMVDTPAAATLLGYRPSTLYRWSSCGDSPLKPVKIGSRVRWRVS